MIINNESFTRTTKNGFSVIIRDSDGYINATKMVNDMNVERMKTPGKKMKYFKSIL